MRIISKFTDFYEYDCYRYGEPDKSITWVRDTLNKKRNITEDSVQKIMRKYFLAGSARDVRCLVGKSCIDKTHICINEYLVGIYPYVYWYPVVYAYYNFHHKYLSIEDSINCLIIPNYYKECFKQNDISLKNVFIPYQILNAGKTVLSYRNDGRNIKNPFIINDTEIFNSDIFVDNEPVFMLVHYGEDCYNDDLFITENPCLVTDSNILSIYFNELSNRDIYNDIENYLWSKKQQPISESDNKTKIISHGFDTKTSFRKM